MYSSSGKFPNHIFLCAFNQGEEIKIKVVDFGNAIRCVHREVCYGKLLKLGDNVYIFDLQLPPVSRIMHMS